MGTGCRQAWTRSGCGHGCCGNGIRPGRDAITILAWIDLDVAREMGCSRMGDGRTQDRAWIEMDA